MKLLHISDLHIGKRVYGYSMLEEQAWMFQKILEEMERIQPDGVILAGDVYDKTVPPAEAVGLFDWFLTAMLEKTAYVFMISGNHDSPERLAFGAALLQRSGVYVSPAYLGRIDPISVQDAFGEVRIYLLPFLKPPMVRRFFPGQAIETYDDMARAVLQSLPLEGNVRNVLVAHQFLTGSLPSESEEVSVGGLEQISAAALEGFDYVALGHLHRPQNVGWETIRYCGTPLKYSFSEARDSKSMTVVTLEEKGQVRVETVPLTPRRDMREIRGNYMEVTDRRRYAGSNTEDFVHIILTDEQDVPGAMDKLRAVYPNLLRLSYDNARTRAQAGVSAAAGAPLRKTPLEWFASLYAQQNGQPMSAAQETWMRDMMQQVWEEQQ